MFRLFSIGLDTLVCSIILVPLCMVLSSRLMEKRSPMYKIIYVFFAVYLISVFSATGMPEFNSVTFDPSFNLVPFLDMRDNLAGSMEGSILNIALFVPMGIFLPLLWKEFRAFKRVTLFGLLFSMGIELLQIFTLRLTDVDDLITNAFGTAVGYCLVIGLSRFLKIDPGVCLKNYSLSGAEEGSCRRELSSVIGLAMAVWFIFSPLVGIIYMIMYDL